MFAFTRLSTGHIVKVYSHADAWQVLVCDPHGVRTDEHWCSVDAWQVLVYDPHGVVIGEHWFSQWQADRPGSLYRAFRVACERTGVVMDSNVLYD